MGSRFCLPSSRAKRVVHSIAAAIEFDNVTSGSLRVASRISRWNVLSAARPSVVVVMPCGYDAARGFEEASRYGDELAGVGADRIVVADASAWFSRPGPRLVEGLEWLGHVLHPDRLPSPPAGVRELQPQRLDEGALADPGHAGDADAVGLPGERQDRLEQLLRQRPMAGLAALHERDRP